MNIVDEIGQEVLKSGQLYGLLDQGEMVFVPEAMPPLTQLAEQITGDLVDYHAHIGKQIQLPVLQRAFCYMFAKGLEAAYLWDESPEGRFELHYIVQDMLMGSVGAQVSHDYQAVINDLLPVAFDAFHVVKDWLIANLASITAVEDGLLLCMQHSLERIGLIGLHRGAPM